MALPQQTAKGEMVVMMKLLDIKTDNFVWSNQFRCLNMIASTYVFDHGFEESIIFVLDMKGFSLAHLAKLEISIIKNMASLIQVRNNKNLLPKYVTLLLFTGWSTH